MTDQKTLFFRVLSLAAKKAKVQAVSDEPGTR